MTSNSIMELRDKLCIVFILIGCFSGCLASRYHTIQRNSEAFGPKDNGNDVHSKESIVEDAKYWKQTGQQLLQDEIRRQRYERIDTYAKNIILFLGDGMSISTVTATRIYKGQMEGGTGEEASLTFEKFPFAALSKTYCTDVQVADSACTATAFLGGVKTDSDTLGLDVNVVFKDCNTQNNPQFHVDSIMTWAQGANKGTGVVTTTRVTHATPAASYAHAANRAWEYDEAVSKDGADASTCDDIAEQLVLNSPGKDFKVIMGGGRSYLTPANVQDPETGQFGSRRDDKNLIEHWLSDHSNGVYVTNRDELANVDILTTDSLLGLFSPYHMEYYLESGTAKNPTLAEMTNAAIRILQKESEGYVLLVEGGLIDQAHHDGRAKLALEEAFQLDLAVATALNMTNRDDTLIIVTADHSHTMTINGYPRRGNPLLGLVQYYETPTLAPDNKPYTTLSYANGPGFWTTLVNGTRANLTNTDTTSDSFKQQATSPLDSESHGGDDVAIFAIGPQAHLFQGVYEQHYIAHVMGYAACIGPGLTFCKDPTAPTDAPTPNPTISPSSGNRVIVGFNVSIFAAVGLFLSSLSLYYQCFHE